MTRARPRRRNETTVSKQRLYEIIRAPLVTEKSTMASEHNQVVFTVPLDAKKPEIKIAVEDLFKVKVKAINTLRQKGKSKRFKGRLGKLPQLILQTLNKITYGRHRFIKQLIQKINHLTLEVAFEVTIKLVLESLDGLL